MICQRCGAYVDNTSLVCVKCGSLLPRKKESVPGIDNIRQGKATAAVKRSAPGELPAESKIYGEEDNFGVPSAGVGKTSDALKTGRSRHNRKLRSYERDAGRPHMQRGVPLNTDSIHMPPIHRREKTVNPISKRSVNWAKLAVAMLGVVLLVMLGVYFYLNNTLNGQVILARRDQATDSQAYWLLGEEYLNQGYITDAVDAFEKAREMDLEKTPAVDNIDGLLLLGAAYEAAARPKDAQALYTTLYEQIVPSRPEPYRNIIRLLMEQGLDREAGELMQKAFEKTGVLTFRQQRTDLLPKTPTTNLAAGRYDLAKDLAYKSLEFSSSQGYDIYYTLDADAVLPQEGTLYTGPIELTEGNHYYRLVCVSGRLVSDPLSASYSVYLPLPPAPKSRLSSGTYTKRRTIYIYPSDGDEKCDLFYTMDGSEPNVEDSPQYTAEGIIPPSGKVKLKMIARNSLGKVSNASEVGYEFNVKPYQKPVYNNKDVFGEFELLKTDIATFEARFGKGSEVSEETLRGFDENCRRITYPWGNILIGRDRAKRNWVLVQVEMNTEICALPRGIRFGNTAQSVMDEFRDSTQPAGMSGNRGMYYSDTGVGRYINLGEGEGMIRYTCRHADGNTLGLEIYLMNDKVTKVKNWYSYE